MKLKFIKRILILYLQAYMTNRCPGERRDQAKFGHRKAVLFKSCLRDILSAEAKIQIFKKIDLCAGF